MKTLIALTVLTVIVALYVVVIRPWLRNKEWMRWFFGNPVIEWIELNLFSKSEMLLWSRFKVLLGSLLTTLVAIDWNSVTPLIPEKYRVFVAVLPTVFMALDGLIGEPLRRDITKPLPMVAITEAVKEEPAVAAAEAQRQVATDVAVEVAQEAEAKAA